MTKRKRTVGGAVRKKKKVAKSVDMGVRPDCRTAPGIVCTGTYASPQYETHVRMRECRWACLLAT